MRIPSGTVDQVIFFVAVDATDLKTRETGLTTFTVYRARDTAAAAAMTTPTVTELDATNMPGVYKLLLDEDMTIAAGNDSEEMVFHITQASMAPVTRTIELYRPKITAGNTFSINSSGNLASGTINSAAFATNAITAGVLDSTAVAEIADAVWDEAQSSHVTAGSFGEIATEIAAILVDTAEIGAAGAGLTEAGGTGDQLTALATQASVNALNDLSAADVNAQVLDVLNTDTFAEPTGVPPATTTALTKLGYLYMALRNQLTITATKMTFYDDAGNAEWEKDLSDDTTTYTETEGNAI